MAPSASRPTVCVAVPVKDGERYLAETLRSVLAQEGVDLEVRVLDNCSTDASVEIARGFAGDPRVTIERNAVDVGYYGSLNRALAETGAPLFVPFAADDVMAPGNLARKVRALRDANAGFAHSTVRLIGAGGELVGMGPDHSVVPPVLAAPDFFLRIAPENKVAPQSVVADTAALRAIGGFDGRSLYAADWLSWMRLSLRHPVATLGEPLVDNRVHAGSGTNSGNALGWNGRDLPATLVHVFRDEALPEGWSSWRDPMAAVANTVVAQTLAGSGIRRVAAGWAEYLALGRAVACQPWDAYRRAHYEHALRATGLTPPAVPCEAVAELPRTAADARALADTAAELGPLVRRLFIAVPEGGEEQALGLMEPDFAACDLDVVLVPGAGVDALLVPGRLTIARWGSDLVARSEDAGVPVHPYALPDPFARAPDVARWETVDASAVLA